MAGFASGTSAVGGMRHHRERMTRVPLRFAPTEIIERTVCVPPLLTVASSNNVLSIKDHAGPRTFGFFYEHSPQSLTRWDAYLDSRDAAHELPDGSLPEAA